MKKIFPTMLCIGLISVNLACFANEAAQIKMNAVKIPLKNSLASKYNSYKITYSNEGKNPVKINSVKYTNNGKLTDITSATSRVKKATIIFYPNEAVNEKDLVKNISSVKIDAEILAPSQSIDFEILVPLNEQPRFIGTFENTVTHKQINVSN